MAGATMFKIASMDVRIMPQHSAVAIDMRNRDGDYTHDDLTLFFTDADTAVRFGEAVKAVFAVAKSEAA